MQTGYVRRETGSRKGCAIRSKKVLMLKLLNYRAKYLNSKDCAEKLKSKREKTRNKPRRTKNLPRRQKVTLKRVKNN